MTMLAKIAENPARALFVVTHDPRIIPFADRILRIEDGRLVSDQRRDKRNGSVLTLKYASGG
jgi:putative ABC transport system ATP-binding protein